MYMLPTSSPLVILSYIWGLKYYCKALERFSNQLTSLGYQIDYQREIDHVYTLLFQDIVIIVLFYFTFSY